MPLPNDTTTSRRTYLMELGPYSGLSPTLLGSGFGTNLRNHLLGVTQTNRA